MTNVTILRPSTRDAIRDYLLRTHGREVDHEVLMECLGPSLNTHIIDLRGAHVKRVLE